MKRREKGTYTNIDNPVVAYTKRHHDASSSVLVTLAERDNYSHLSAEMKVAEIMLETNLGQRGVEKCLKRLESEGLAAQSANGWAYSGANCRANRDANKVANGQANQDANEPTNRRANENANSRSLNSEKKTDQDDKQETLKDLEGIKKETKDKNTPLTPQGGTDAGEPKSRERVQSQTQDSNAGPATAPDTEPVPRRRAAPIALPDDLAALPGVPESWLSWQKYAREIKLKLTESVSEAQFAKLRNLSAEGWDLPRIVQHAIENGWRSFYPIRSEKPRRNLQLDPPEPEKPRTREEWLS